MTISVGLAALAWQAGQGTTDFGAPRHVPQPALGLFVLGALIGLYFLLAPLLRWWPYCKQQVTETAPSPDRRALDVRVRGYGRQSLPNWTPDYEEDSSGAVRCKVYSGDGDKRRLAGCRVTAPGEVTSEATLIPREPQAFFEFSYPAHFEGSVATLPLSEGQYRVEWNEVGGGLLRIHAFRIVDGHLSKGD